MSLPVGSLSRTVLPSRLIMRALHRLAQILTVHCTISRQGPSSVLSRLAQQARLAARSPPPSHTLRNPSQSAPGRCCVQLPGSQHRRCDELYGLQFDQFRHVCVRQRGHRQHHSDDGLYLRGPGVCSGNPATVGHLCSRCHSVRHSGERPGELGCDQIGKSAFACNSSAKPPRSTTLPWSNTRFSSASHTVDRRCEMMNVVRPATGSSAPARPAPRSPHPARQSLRPGSESADPSAVNCVVVPQSHMITSFPMRETHNPPTAPSGSRFPLGTAMPARRRR